MLERRARARVRTLRRRRRDGGGIVVFGGTRTAVACVPSRRGFVGGFAAARRVRRAGREVRRSAYLRRRERDVRRREHGLVASADAGREGRAGTDEDDESSGGAETTTRRDEIIFSSRARGRRTRATRGVNGDGNARAPSVISQDVLHDVVAGTNAGARARQRAVWSADSLWRELNKESHGDELAVVGRFFGPGPLVRLLAPVQTRGRTSRDGGRRSPDAAAISARCE